MKLIKSSKIGFWLLIIVIALAGFFRLYNITTAPPGLYPDEAMNGTNAQEAIATNNFKVFYPENFGREGLFMNIQAVSISIFGNEPWALRIVSSVFGIFTVVGVFFLTKILFKHKGEKYAYAVALLSAFLIATNFWHINFSRIGFRAIMAPFFLVWTLYFVFKYFDKEKFINIILAGVFLGLGFYSYIAFRATPLIIAFVFGYYFVTQKHSRLKIIKDFFILALVSLIMFAPLGYHFIKTPADFFGRTSQISIFSSQSPLLALGENVIKTLGMFIFTGDRNWRHNLSGEPELFWPVGIMFIVGTGLGIYYLFKNIKNISIKKISEEQFPFLVLFSWIAVALLPVVISSESIPHALRSILMIPPVIILAGFGGVKLYGKLANKFPGYKNILTAVSCVLLILIAAKAYDAYFVKWAKNPNTARAFNQEYVDIARKLNSLPIEQPKYVIVEASGPDTVRGIPIATQPVMFMTDTFTPDKQRMKNIFYMLPDQINQIPQGAYTIKLT